MRISLCLALTLFMISACAVQPETGSVSGVEIVGFGIEKQDDDSSKQQEFFEETTRIQFERGVKYGLRFRVLGEPEGSSVQLKLLWITTPSSKTTKKARSDLFTRKLSTEVGKVYYMTSRTSFDGDLRLPYRAKFVVGHRDGTIFAEKDFWVVEKKD